MKNKLNIKRIFAMLMIFVLLLMLVLLLYAAFTNNQRLLLAMLFSIIFVSIVFYVSKWFLKITNDKSR